MNDSRRAGHDIEHEFVALPMAPTPQPQGISLLGLKALASADEIAAPVRLLRGAVAQAPASADESAWRVLLEGLRLGIIATSPSQGARVVRCAEPAPPEVVHLLVTDRCNYRCPSCYVSPDASGAAPLDLAEWKALVDDLAGAGVLELALGGGEPLIFDGLAELIRHASPGLLVNVTTNGSLLDDACAQKLRTAGVNMVTVSLNGDVESLNATSRAAGSHDAALRALRALDRNGVRAGANILVTRSLVGRLDRVLHLAQELGVHQVILIRPKPRAAEDAWFDTHGIRRADWLTLASEIRSLPARFPAMTVTVDASFGPLFWDVPSERLTRSGFRGLGAATTSCCIDPRGQVYPGSHFTQARFRAGSLREAPFSQTWRQSAVLRDFRMLAEGLRGACADCPTRPACLGGCRKTALVGGDLHGEDPCCPRARPGPRELCDVRQPGAAAAPVRVVQSILGRNMNGARALP